MSQSLFTVSIYDVLGPSTMEYIINHSELTCVFASLPHTVILLKLKPQLPSLKFIVCLDPIDGDELKGCTKRDMLNSLAIHLLRRMLLPSTTPPELLVHRKG